MWLPRDVDNVYLVNVPVLTEYMIRRLMSVSDLSELNFGKNKKRVRKHTFCTLSSFGGENMRVLLRSIYLSRRRGIRQWWRASMNLISTVWINQVTRMRTLIWSAWPTRRWKLVEVERQRPSRCYPKEKVAYDLLVNTVDGD
jgi:hypothetical protein